MHIFSSIFFGISANMDAFVLGFSYGIKKQYLSLLHNFFISLIAFFGTLISIKLGTLASTLFPPLFAQIFGILFLLLLGLYYCGKYIIIHFFPKTTTATIAKSSVLTTKESVFLGITLACNNAGMGIGGGLAGIHFLIASTSTFFFSSIFLLSGNRLGFHRKSTFLQQCGDLISGLVILLLVIYEFLSCFFL